MWKSLVFHDLLLAFGIAQQKFLYAYSVRYSAAELDCSQAITLNPTYTKAYSRRGAARFALKKYDDAKKDFERVLSLEPKNREAKQQLEKIEQVSNTFTHL